jgi:hypothetical protein
MKFIQATLFMFFQVCMGSLAFAQVRVTPYGEPEYMPIVSVVPCEIAATSVTIRVQARLPNDAYVRRRIGEPIDLARIYINVTSLDSSDLLFPTIGNETHFLFNGYCPVINEDIGFAFAPPDTLYTSYAVFDKGLQPRKAYKFRVSNIIRTFIPGNFDPQTFGTRETSLVVTTGTVAPQTTPKLFPARQMYDEGFTLSWQAPNGTSPDSYILDIATDSLFQRKLPAYTNLFIRTTSIRVAGLRASTPYFIRLQAVTGNTAPVQLTSSREQTLSLRRYNADRLSFVSLITTAPRVSLDKYIAICSGTAHYYSSATTASLSFPQTDSLLARLMDAGLPLDSAWAQDNSTCDGNNNGSSELLVKLKTDDPRIRTFGFSKRYNNWASSCECRGYRLYYNFGTPVSVREDVPVPLAQTTPLELAPNPASDLVQLAWQQERAGAVELTLMDMLGRVVQSHSLGVLGAGQQRTSLSVGELPTGVYALHLEVGGQVLPSLRWQRVVVAR